MEGKSPDFWRTMQDTATRVVNDGSRLWQSYVDFWLPRSQQTAKGADASSLGDSARSAGERTARLVREVTGLTTSYYRGLYQLGRTFAEEALGGTLGLGTAGRGSSGAVIELSAPVGKEATASFFVENKRTNAMDVDLAVTTFSAVPGPEAFEPGLIIEPARFTLGAGEERRISLRLPLEAGRFKPGASYVATIMNRGDPDTQVLLRVRVPTEASTASAAGAQASGASGAR